MFVIDFAVEKIINPAFRLIDYLHDKDAFRKIARSVPFRILVTTHRRGMDWKIALARDLSST